MLGTSTDGWTNGWRGRKHLLGFKKIILLIFCQGNNLITAMVIVIMMVPEVAMRRKTRKMRMKRIVAASRKA